MSEDILDGQSDSGFQAAIRRFRQEIGGHHTLPTPSHTLPQPTRKGRYRRRLVPGLSIVLLVALGSYVAPLLAGPDTIPTELVGRWTTDNAGYEGRFLSLTPDSLILGVSAREATGYGVRRVKRRRSAAGSDYVITAHSELGGEYNLTLEYRIPQQTIAQGKPAHVLWYRAP